MAENPYDAVLGGGGGGGGGNPYDAILGEPTARITVRPGSIGAPPQEDRAAAALNIPVSYDQLVRSGLAAMSAGTGEVAEGARGLVNPNADRPSLGPIPISARLKAVGDILGGLGKTGAGAVEYTTAPLMAPVRAIASQPLENVTGLPREYTEFAASLAAPVPKTLGPVRVPREAAPTIEELRAEASSVRGYNAPDVTGTMLPPKAGTQLADQLRIDLNAARKSDVNAPNVFKLVDKLETPQGAVGMSVENLESFRQQLGDISKPIKDGTGKVINSAEIAAASVARQRVDQFLKEFPQEQALSGSPAAASEALAYGREHHAAAESAELINRKEFRAELRAAAAHSGQNISNTMRARIADILLDPAQRRGFEPAELEMMDRIVRGTKTENLIRRTGKFLGGGGGLGAMVTTAEGVRALGPVGALAAVPGAALSSLSNVLTRANIDKLNTMVRSDSPLGRQMRGPIKDYEDASQAFQVSPTTRNLARITISARNLANNLRDAGIQVSPDRLIGGGRSVPASEESEQ